MTASLAFFCPCVPPTTTHQRKQIVRRGPFVGIGDTPELEKALAFLESVLLPHQPTAPVAGAVRLDLAFVWPFLAGAPKRVKALGLVRRTTKPDCSNLAKTLEDRLTTLRFIDDDARVAEGFTSKWFGQVAGIAVAITPLDELRWDDSPTIDQAKALVIARNVTLAVPAQLAVPAPSQHGLFAEAQPS